jgi:signal transduction histidine kinase
VDVPAQLPNLPLGAEVRHNLLLAVREILNNSLKHSKCNQVWIVMEYSHSQIAIQIRDNGVGILAPTGRTGNGLENIRRRLETLGGHVNIESASSGTRVTLALRIAQ